MDIQMVGTRGVLFTFQDLGIPTNVYAINGKQHIYIIDTYLGTEPMLRINHWLDGQYGKKDKIIVNTHSHWDHVWGNCLYPNNPIIAHSLCYEYMKRDWEEDMIRQKEYIRGDVTLQFPNYFIDQERLFDRDQILLMHSPGHTEDCISVVDYVDKVLFAGDNLERPIPYTYSSDLTSYVNTLERYLDFELDTVIGGHTGCEGKELILDNLRYIRKLIERDTQEYESDEYKSYHDSNQEWLRKYNLI